ncbi:MAG TPA: rhomboid family intramembrane serine protease [Kofleriaceae bacterium]
MIIPIGHDQSIRRMPWVTIGIIAICTLMQIYASFIAPSEEDIAQQLLVLAESYAGSEEPATPEELQALEQHAEALKNRLPVYRFGYKTGSGLSLALVTSAFVHGGWFHLIGNMLFLWLAGSALEDRYGRLRYAVFYLIGAVAATFAYELTAEGEHLLVGASGAISACMGAFLIHFRKTEITFWYLIMYRSGTFRLAAWVALPMWLAEQFLYVFLYRSMGAVSHVAYAAHIGGFLAGMGAGFAMSKLFPQDAEHDDVEYDVPAQPRREVDAQLDERIAKCLAAIKARDLVAVRQLSSRVILDLARVGNDGRVLELYRELAKQLATPPLTDGAFAAAATAADRLNDRRTFVTIAGTMMAEHPGSIQLPKVLWRLSQVHREQREYELEQEILRTLATKFPRHELGQKAQLELQRQR